LRAKHTSNRPLYEEFSVVRGNDDRDPRLHGA
jgi:hypothetical protein